MPSRRSLAALLAVSLLACGSQGGESGRVTVLLKDAPAEFQAAVVTIAEVHLLGPSKDVILTATPTTTNLLTLANDVARLVDGVTIPTGPYSELRLVITGGYVDVGGRIYASSPSYEGLPPGAAVAGVLRMPSYDQSGLKVKLPEGFTVGSDSELVVDFDVSQSFGHAAGGSDAWVMHPVLKATESRGMATLEVQLALAPEFMLPEGIELTGFRALLTPAAGGDGTQVPITAGADGAVGTATFRFLCPGEYTVSFEAPATIGSFVTDPEVPLSVTVSSGQTTRSSFLLLLVVPLEP